MAEPASSFIWGPGGAQMTPERIAAQRKVAQALLAQGMDYSPIRSPWQGAARVSQALMGGLESGLADRAEKANLAADREMITSLLAGHGGGMPAADPAAAPMAAPVGAPARAGVGGTTDPSRWKIYSNDEPSPLDPPQGQDKDLAVRTVLAEAGNQGPTGQLAVANVIRKRAIDGGYGGDNVPAVVTARNQFEPWNTQAGRTKMASIDPNGPAYAQAGAAVDQAYTGAADPTNGATHFYAPKAQAALGRQPPAWDNGSGVNIGDHRFFGGKGGQPAAVQPAEAQVPPVQMAQAQPQAAGGLQGVNPALLRAVTSPYASEGTKKIAGIMLQHALQGDAVTTVDLGNEVGIMDKRGNLIRRMPKGEPNKGPEFGEVGTDPQNGEKIMGWRNPRDQSVTPYRPQASTSQPSVVPPVPPGVDPKVWREGQSKNVLSENLPPDQKIVSGLRKEIQELPSYKNLAQAAPVYNSMQEAAGRDTRAADVNLIYGLAKIMDPGSVVRESEMTVAQAVATLPQQLRASIESQLTSSGRLTPEVREAIMQEAYGRMGSYNTMFGQDTKMFRGIAKRGRILEEDVIPDFGEFKPWTKPAPAAPTAPQPGFVKDGFRFKGGNPADRNSWEKAN